MIHSAKLGKLAANAAVILVSLVVAIVMLETAIRIIAPQQLVLLRPDIWQPTDGLGHRLAADVDTVINTGEREVRLRTNSQGYRIGTTGRREGEIRILAIGDSYLEALQVEYDQTMTARLADTLTQTLGVEVEVVNTGVSGYGPSHYLIKAGQETNRNEYDLLLVFVYLENDITRFRSNHFPRRQPQSRPLQMPQEISFEAFVDTIIYPIYVKLRSRSHLVVFLKGRLLRLWTRMGLSRRDFPSTVLLSEANSQVWDTTSSILLDIESHGPTCFLLLPPDYQVDRELGNAYAMGSGIDTTDVDFGQPSAILEAKLRPSCVLDLAPALEAAHMEGIKAYGNVDRHLTPTGHEVVVKALTPFVLQRLRSLVDGHTQTERMR
jgi:hypothetical protein